MKVIDATPTWEQIIPALIMLIENETVEGRKLAIEELTRMAKLADAYIETNKEQSK